MKKQIEKSHIFLLLISTHYLASDFLLNSEMTSIFEFGEKADKLIIPIILEPCDWEAVELLSKRIVLPRDGEPLSTFAKHRQDEAFDEIVKQILKSVLYIKNKNK